MANTTQSERPLALGIDLGATTAKAVVLDAENQTLLDRSVETPSQTADGPAATIERIRALGEQTVAAAGRSLEEVACVGVCPAGPTKNGVLLSTPNYGHPDWRNVDFGAALSQRLGRAVYAFNDGNAGAFGEYTLRPEAADKTLGMAAVGTGLGGGVIDGRKVQLARMQIELGRAEPIRGVGDLLEGAHGCAHEWGHIPLCTPLLDGQPCPESGTGKLYAAETFISLTALDRQLRWTFDVLRDSRWRDHPLREKLDHSISAAYQLRSLANGGDAFALELFDQQARALGVLLAVIALTYNPDVIVIGGGVTEGAFIERYLEEVRTRFAEVVPFEALRATVIEKARRDDMAACIGAAALARLQLQFAEVAGAGP